MRWLLPVLLLLPGVAMAQGFTLPGACARTGASGAGGDDPVVLVIDNFANRYVLTPVNVFSATPPIVWSTTISPFRGGLSGYTIIVTYTPFLTADKGVSDASSAGAYTVLLPQPGVTGGRATEIYDVFTVRILAKDNKTPVPNAFVDFVPDFIGSSPLTIQANAQGVVTLYCVQQNFQGYNITVHDSTGEYLYDGSFPASSQGLRDAATGAISVATRSRSASPNPKMPVAAPPILPLASTPK